MVSRYGGMVNQGNAVAIPVQSWEQQPPLWGSRGFEHRHAPSHSVVGAGVPGYTGFRPHGSQPTVLGSMQRSLNPNKDALWSFLK